jgi:hypothetical protein
MNSLIKNIFRFAILILLQVFVLDKILLHQLITPYVYFVFILWLPFNINRSVLMIVSFILGATLDSFRHNPGFHAAACVLIAYIRPFVINLMIPQEGAETNYDEPSVKSFGGFIPYFIYAGFLMLLHNTWLFLLEAWQFADLYYFFMKTILSTLISLLLLLIIEMIFYRKQKFRTNTI